MLGEDLEELSTVHIGQGHEVNPKSGCHGPHVKAEGLEEGRELEFLAGGGIQEFWAGGVTLGPRALFKEAGWAGAEAGPTAVTTLNPIPLLALPPPGGSGAEVVETLSPSPLLPSVVPTSLPAGRVVGLLLPLSPLPPKTKIHNNRIKPKCVCVCVSWFGCWLTVRGCDSTLS